MGSLPMGSLQMGSLPMALLPPGWGCSPVVMRARVVAYTIARQKRGQPLVAVWVLLLTIWYPYSRVLERVSH